jgi:hypothetical protein
VQVARPQLPARTRAAQALCEMLDQNATIFPGARLRMRFAGRAAPSYRPRFPGLPRRAQHGNRRRPSPPIGAETGHLCAMLC